MVIAAGLLLARETGIWLWNKVLDWLQVAVGSVGGAGMTIHSVPWLDLLGISGVVAGIVILWSARKPAETAPHNVAATNKHDRITVSAAMPRVADVADRAEIKEYAVFVHAKLEEPRKSFNNIMESVRKKAIESGTKLEKALFRLLDNEQKQYNRAFDEMQASIDNKQNVDKLEALLVNYYSLYIKVRKWVIMVPQCKDFLDEFRSYPEFSAFSAHDKSFFDEMEHFAVTRPNVKKTIGGARGFDMETFRFTLK